MIKEKKAGNVEKYYITIDQITLSNISSSACFLHIFLQGFYESLILHVDFF